MWYDLQHEKFQKKFLILPFVKFEAPAVGIVGKCVCVCVCVCVRVSIHTVVSH